MEYVDTVINFVTLYGAAIISVIVAGLNIVKAAQSIKQNGITSKNIQDANDSISELSEKVQSLVNENAELRKELKKERQSRTRIKEE